MAASYDHLFCIFVNQKALQEAKDINLHLQPLHAHLSQLENKAFPLWEECIPALFHTLYLIWTNCGSYQRPARIVVLLQEQCNMLIEQVRLNRISFQYWTHVHI